MDNPKYTSKSDIELAEKRLKRIRARKDQPFIKGEEEKKSA
jgi:phage-related protein